MYMDFNFIRDLDVLCIAEKQPNKYEWDIPVNICLKDVSYYYCQVLLPNLLLVPCLVENVVRKDLT